MPEHETERHEQKKVIAQKAIIRRGERFLIMRRSATVPRFPELWDFLGGRLEEGENPIVGLKREVREEASIEISVGENTWRYDYNEGRPVHFVLYPSEITFGDMVLGQEHSEFRWATIDEIRSLQTMPFMNSFLDSLENDI